MQYGNSKKSKAHKTTFEMDFRFKLLYSFKQNRNSGWYNNNKNFSHGKIYYYLVPRHLSLCRGSEGVDMTTFITERYQQLLYFILLHGYRIGSLLGGIVFTLKHQTK